MLSKGALFFPVTPFAADGRVDDALLRDHIEDHLAFPVGAVFAACGTGEFHSLSASEVGTVVGTARDVVPSDINVFGAAGGPLGHAIECARIARDAGANGLLIMAPYVANYDLNGHVRYVEQLLDATDLPAIVYHRPEAPFQVEAVKLLLGHPRFVGFKDGMGDRATAEAVLATTREQRGEDFIMVNGLALAERAEQEYSAIGIPRYSSGSFTMLPQVAYAYSQGRAEGNTALCDELLERFYHPMDLLRRQAIGSTVSLAKAAVRLGGFTVGPVRAPIEDLDEQQEAELRRLLDIGLEVIGA